MTTADDTAPPRGHEPLTGVEVRCRAEYTPPGGRQRGDRLVLCDLPRGHDGEHEETDTEVRWISPVRCTFRILDRRCDQIAGHVEPHRVMLTVPAADTAAPPAPDLTVTAVTTEQNAEWLRGFEVGKVRGVELLRAEVERLDAENDGLTDENQRLAAEVERLTAGRDAARGDVFVGTLVRKLTEANDDFARLATAVERVRALADLWAGRTPYWTIEFADAAVELRDALSATETPAATRPTAEAGTAGSVALTGGSEPVSRDHPTDPRPFEDLRPTGLLWLINAAVFHPRGFALALCYDGGRLAGWRLLGDGSEPWRFEGDSIDRHFGEVEALFAAHRPTAWAVPLEQFAAETAAASPEFREAYERTAAALNAARSTSGEAQARSVCPPCARGEHQACDWDEEEPPYRCTCACLAADASGEVASRDVVHYHLPGSHQTFCGTAMDDEVSSTDEAGAATCGPCRWFADDEAPQAETPRVWHLPDEPGPEVTAVRDREQGLWRRDEAGWRYEYPEPLPEGVRAVPFAWRPLLDEYAPLTDASGEVPDA